MVLSLMDIPNKSEFLGRVRSAMGGKKDFDKMTPEEQQAAQAEAEQLAEQQRLMMRKMVAEVMTEEAAAAAKQAEAEGSRLNRLRRNRRHWKDSRPRRLKKPFISNTITVKSTTCFKYGWLYVK